MSRKPTKRPTCKHNYNYHCYPDPSIPRRKDIRQLLKDNPELQEQLRVIAERAMCINAILPSVTEANQALVDFNRRTGIRYRDFFETPFLIERYRHIFGEHLDRLVQIARRDTAEYPVYSVDLVGNRLRNLAVSQDREPIDWDSATDDEVWQRMQLPSAALGLVDRINRIDASALQRSVEELERSAQQAAPVFEAAIEQMQQAIITATQIPAELLGVDVSNGSDYSATSELIDCDRPQPCIGCRHYHGATYYSNRLICAMHPYGCEQESCPDHEEVPCGAEVA